MTQDDDIFALIKQFQRFGVEVCCVVGECCSGLGWLTRGGRELVGYAGYTKRFEMVEGRVVEASAGEGAGDD